jgi:hypothetical protein
MWRKKWKRWKRKPPDPKSLLEALWLEDLWLEAFWIEASWTEDHCTRR